MAKHLRNVWQLTVISNFSEVDVSGQTFGKCLTTNSDFKFFRKIEIRNKKCNGELQSTL